MPTMEMVRSAAGQDLPLEAKALHLWDSSIWDLRLHSRYVSLSNDESVGCSGSDRESSYVELHVGLEI